MRRSDGEGYAFEGVPIDPVDPGTNILVSGPSLGGARTLLLRMLAGPAAEGVVCVAADAGAASVVESFGDVGGAVNGDCLRVIDCSGDEATPVSDAVRRVGSPADLTGIGMEFSSCYESLYAAGRERVRTGIYTLAPLLVYAEDARTVFRFLHTVTARIRSADGLGVFGVDPAAQDGQTFETIKQAFDGVVELRESESGPEIRVRGFPEQSTEWRQFDPAAVIESVE